MLKMGLQCMERWRVLFAPNMLSSLKAPFFELFPLRFHFGFTSKMLNYKIHTTLFALLNVVS